MRRIVMASVLVLLAGPALAHTGTEALGGFGAGFLHPVLGWDHVLAMVAVGLWGALLGMPLIWLLPVTFPLMMALAGLLGGLGLELPAMEQGIAASVLVLGAMVALRARPPLPLAVAIVAVWAVFHGWAHGAELPASADPFAYGVGFVLATGLLHLLGIGLGLLVRWPQGERVLRLAGAAIGVAGLWLLAGTGLA